MPIPKTSASIDVLLFFILLFPGANVTLSCLSYQYRSAALLCGCQCKGRRTAGTYFSLGAPINRMFVVTIHRASLATVLVRENSKFNTMAWLITFLWRFLEKHVMSSKHFLAKGTFLHVWTWKTYKGKKYLLFLRSFLILTLIK